MFVAHLPAGYLLSFALRDANSKTTKVALLARSILLDLDLASFYFLDAHSHHHHTYLTHRPTFRWGLFVLAKICGWIAPAFGQVFRLCCVGALLHLSLDTISGAVDWGWPLLSLVGPLDDVPARFSLWYLSFLLHWTFLIELTLCILAALLWRRQVRGARTLRDVTRKVQAPCTARTKEKPRF